MRPAYEAEQLRVLAQIVDNGHVVRGFKPVHWCLDCGSSLAEAEVEYQDKQSSAVDVKFAAADVADLAKRFGVADASGAAFVIWTRSAEHTSELQSLMRISYAVFCLKTTMQTTST